MEKTLYIIGVGPGNPQLLTEEARVCIGESEVLLGPQRLIECTRPIASEKSIKIACKLGEMEALIESHAYKKQLCILASGDIGFYSIADWVKNKFEDKFKIRYITGISSLQYFCNLLQKPYNGIHTVSVHGRENSVLGEVLTHPKVFVLTGGTYKVQHVCQLLTCHGLGDVKVYVGEYLSYKEERIIKGSAKELGGETFDDLAVMLIERSQEDEIKTVSYGLPDESFIRGKVPMTKEEVRSVCLSKLRLVEDDIVYDIGAGTGSVAIEMARICPKGYVYAIEKNSEAVELIKVNQKKFEIYNMDVIKAICPEGMELLPPPSKAFIGGSSGNLKEIVQMLLVKNKDIRIVLTAITLETLSEALSCKVAYNLSLEVTQMSVVASKCIGDYHMMMAQNPIFIIIMKGEMQ